MSGGRVLVVDESAAIKNLERWLTSAGWQVLHIKDRGDALDLSMRKEVRADVILLRMARPFTSFLAVAAALTKGNPTIPLMVLCPVESASLTRELQKHGCPHIYPDPESGEELQAWLNQVHSTPTDSPPTP